MIFGKKNQILPAVMLSALAVSCIRSDKIQENSGTLANFTTDFGSDHPGPVGKFWKISATSPSGRPAGWNILNFDGKNVLTVGDINHHSSDTFNLCWTKEIRFLNGTLTTRLKAVRGVIDQGGGLIWHVADENNYYLARYNPLEKNLRLFIVENGERKTLGNMRTFFAANEWQDLKIRHIGSHIEIFLNGNKVIDSDDGSLKNSSGGVGFWTKADARTMFDFLKVENDLAYVP
ncbi:MAG: hypothetical protein HQK54_13155 [Oligoflexales bacterium]|nr:hypothetical protein [Oligoflexales bacterium]